ncbi:DctP family TRAP transporter solute-binding subunit [Marinococcus luteus]|uniref:DctP family TRAP transporter solute-binding subunit n=1 Tax=Marinococcus luteus TaxID=1122204 RepID=UPI002ACCA104|nr:DctP family TRAP transporter solute-binding subunit [Marinococcus luteus]MDZ5783920.1 DctP family TRAP transporter solute-binding subunit [Marinococcus luteus]
MKKTGLGLTVAAGAFLISGCSPEVSGNQSDEPKKMRLAVATSEDRSLTQGLYEFQEIVEEETNGEIDVEVYPSGVLGGDRQVLEGMQLNTIQGTTVSTGPVAQFAPVFNLFDLPYLFEDRETAHETLDSSIGEDLLEELPEQNLVGLNYWENGFRQLTNSQREIDSLEDVEGLDIRTLENDLHMQLWEELGANPTPMSYTELYVGLEQGTVDGQENPVGNVVNDNFYEVQPYLTETDHVYNASLFALSKPFWDSLSDEEKTIVENAADEAKEYQRDLNEEESEEGIDFLKEQGVTVTELSDSEKENFEEAAQPVYDTFTEEHGSEELDRIRDRAEEAEN